jgi:rhodanese-related sulfurtransferase
MKVSCTKFAQMYKKANKDKILLLDVRTPAECAEGMLSESLNIPLGDLEERYQEIPLGKEIYIYCRSGGRAERAEAFFIRKGIKTTKYVQPGGYEDLKSLM